MTQILSNSKILITGGAGFIGSNLVEYFLRNNNEVVCLDNLSTGHRKNIIEFLDHPNFQMVEGDIRDLDTCKSAVRDCEFVFHQAALGSVPRSIKDPVTTNSVNIDGFLNMLTAARDEEVKRFIYAASSSTYGDLLDKIKVEDRIGRPLSPYAITKVVNEYFAQVYSEIYGLETIGLRYFNVFGRRQDPNGAYAAVIPLWIKKLLALESPVINGSDQISRDFTYIDNVIHANEVAATTPTPLFLERLNAYYRANTETNGNGSNLEVVMDVFNVACGKTTSLRELLEALKHHLSRFDDAIRKIEAEIGPARDGDVAYSLASIEKAESVLGYDSQFSVNEGLEAVCQWYWDSIT